MSLNSFLLTPWASYQSSAAVAIVPSRSLTCAKPFSFLHRPGPYSLRKPWKRPYRAANGNGLDSLENHAERLARLEGKFELLETSVAARRQRLTE
jgi:hypothetical protein